MLREMCATGSPPKVTLAERSYQVPRTSSSTCLPSDSFLKVTVDSLVRILVVVREDFRGVWWREMERELRELLQGWSFSYERKSKGRERHSPATNV